LKRFLDFKRLERLRLLRPVRHHLQNSALRRFDRHSVARGVAVGFFFGILTPVAQIVFAAAAAVFVRANLVVAAVSTLITNPFTFPFVYYFAFQLGAAITGYETRGSTDVIASEQAAQQALDVAGWFPTLANWVQSIGPPLAVGVLTLALACAVVGYLLVHTFWVVAKMLRSARRGE
jgi:uncharacterized protein